MPGSPPIYTGNIKPTIRESDAVIPADGVILNSPAPPKAAAISCDNFRLLPVAEK